MEVAGKIKFTPLNVCVSYSPGMYLFFGVGGLGRGVTYNII